MSLLVTYGNWMTLLGDEQADEGALGRRGSDVRVTC